MSQQLKILHTVEHYHPKIGGAELVVKRVSEGLVDRGHHVSVATGCAGDAPSRENVAGVDVVRMNISGNRARGIKGDVGIFYDLLSEDWDVILNYACQSWPTDLTFDRLDDLEARTLLAPCGYSGLAGSTLRRLVYSRYFRRLPHFIRKYDDVVYHSASYLDYRMGERWGLANGTVIPNGVALKEFAPFVPITDRKPEIVLVGNHFRVKGHDVVFDLVRRSSWPPGGRAIIVASSAHSSRRTSCADGCRRLAAKLGVKLLNGDSRVNVVDAIRHARVIVIPSRIECFPLVALEAMAAGTPFVGFDVGNLRELPGGVVVTDAGEMSTEVARLLKDDGYWEQLSILGRRAADSFDWGRVIDRYEELYSYGKG